METKQAFFLAIWRCWHFRVSDGTAMWPTSLQRFSPVHRFEIWSHSTSSKKRRITTLSRYHAIYPLLQDSDRLIYILSVCWQTCTAKTWQTASETCSKSKIVLSVIVLPVIKLAFIVWVGVHRFGPQNSALERVYFLSETFPHNQVLKFALKVIE